MAKIKQVHIGNIDYDLDAAYLGGLSAEEWENMIDAHSSTIYGPYSSSSNPESPVFGQEASTLYNDTTPYVAGSSYDGAIYLFNHTHDSSPYYEWIIVNKGDEVHPNYTWKCIGSTSTDLQNYVKKGTYTTTVPSPLSTGTPSTANTDFAVYDSQSIDPNEVTIAMTIPVTSHSIYNGKSGKTISQLVTTIGNHQHVVYTNERTVVTTTPSWTATVSSEVLSFTFVAGSTSTVSEVSGFDTSAQDYLTSASGSHDHSLREYTGGSWTAIASSFNVVNDISTTLAYFVGTVPSTAVVVQDVKLNVTIRQHTHSMSNHTHSMSSHTHEITLN